MEVQKRYVTLAVSLFVALALSGCLSQEKDEESVAADPEAPAENSPPTISGNPAAAVKIGDAYSFTPDASDPDGDTLTFSIENQPAWADFSTTTGTVSGQPSLGDVGIYSDIRVSVSDGQAEAAMNGFSISVDQTGTFSTTLSWSAPTENEDGSQLTDLAGYKLYWGTMPGRYTNSVTIDNPSVTTFVVDNLTEGTYEFVATSFNDAGVESAYSNPATKTLPET